jgi:hypothetical protein
VRAQLDDFCVLGDSREEIIVWGRHALVIGTLARGTGCATIRRIRPGA